MSHTHSTQARGARRAIILPVLGYLAAWGLMVAFFWLTPNRSGSMAFGYALLVIWGLLPLLTLAVSAVVGSRVRGAAAWAAVPVLGCMFMLLPYVTFYLANTLTFGNVNAPDAGAFLAGAVCSAAGVLLGRALAARRLRAAVPLQSA